MRTINYLLLVLLMPIGIQVHGQTTMKWPSYDCLTQHLDTELWLLENMRSFDTHGVLLGKRQYHPVEIFTYGLMRYDDFQRSGDTAQLRSMIDQFHFFGYDQHVEWVDIGRGLALQYQFNWKDLQAPWISGMSQGMAISYLLRYHSLTGDSCALNMVQAACNVLLKPVEKGGCLGRTPEGMPWLEEYPGSASYRQVLNGFIIAWIGLYEYCMQFPEESYAASMRDSCFDALVATISFYDNVDWTDYMRVRNSVLQLHYMRFELAQIAHLRQLRPNSSLQRQGMIWAHMMYGRIDTFFRSYRFPKYQFGWEAMNGDTAMVGEHAFSEIMEPIAQGDVRRCPKWKAHGCKWDLQLPPETYYIQLYWDDHVNDAQIDVQATSGDGQPIELMTVSEQKLTQVRSHVAIQSITITTTKKNLRLLGAQRPAIERGLLPLTGIHLLSGRHKCHAGQRFRIEIVGKNLAEALLFYRYDPLTASNYSSSWHKDRYIQLPQTTWTAPADGNYEFLLAFPISQPGQRITVAKVNVE